LPAPRQAHHIPEQHFADLVCLSHAYGYTTGINLERLTDVARRVDDVLGRTLPSPVMRAGPRLRLVSLGSVRRAVG